MSATRRDFLCSSVAAASIALAAPAVHAQDKAKRYRTALIGTGWWGMNILGEAVASDECEVVAMCDVDENQLNGALEKLEHARRAISPSGTPTSASCSTSEKPEICIVATPDHWHPLVMIAAVKAGANVYVEKPIGHTIREGRAMVKAARDTGKVVQVGTHRRVSPHNVSGMEFLKSGKAGKIGMVRAFVHYGGNGPEQPRPNEEPPKGLTGTCGAAPARCGRTTRRSIPRASASSSTTPTARSATGAFTGWTRFCGGPTRMAQARSPRSAAGTSKARGQRRHGQTTDAPDTQVASSSSTRSPPSGSTASTPATTPRKAKTSAATSTAPTARSIMAWQEGWTFYPANDDSKAQHQDPQLHEPDDQNIKELFADFLGASRTKRARPCATSRSATARPT